MFRSTRMLFFRSLLVFLRSERSFKSTGMQFLTLFCQNLQPLCNSKKNQKKTQFSIDALILDLTGRFFSVLSQRLRRGRGWSPRDTIETKRSAARFGHDKRKIIDT